MTVNAAAQAVTQAARGLCEHVETLAFSPPVACVYNPLRYAWRPHQAYLHRFARPTCRVVFLGMNPGPWGMAQTGVPFGEVAAVRDWMDLQETVDQPADPHLKRPIQGLACPRSEVSGRRLWGLFSQRFPKPDDFFREHFVLNYCPLVFMAESGKNLTPDKLPASERQPLEAACDDHLRRVIHALQPQWLVGVGAFAQTRAHHVLAQLAVNITRILHPSPASPAANRGWSEHAARQLIEAGVWPSG